eukprot:5335805-Amphidinium_carterae.2
MICKVGYSSSWSARICQWPIKMVAGGGVQPCVFLTGMRAWLKPIHSSRTVVWVGVSMLSSHAGSQDNRRK